jgi:opacity protein-like surface antigen
MKKFFALLGLAVVLSSAAQAEEGSEFWFNDGLAWYQHPCGLQAFVKYGGSDTRENRHNYYLALKHPEMCSKLFP